MSRKKLGKWFVLILHLAVVFLFHVYGYIGHYGYDDMEYAEAAVKLLNGSPDYSNHFTHRWSITAPTAAAFALTGIDDMGAALPSLVFTVLIALFVSLVLWRRGAVALSIGLTLTLFPQWFLFYTDKLMPDIAVAFFILTSVLAYWYGSRSLGRKTVFLAVAFSLSLVLGFLAKGTIVLALPWITVIFTLDLVKKKAKRFWIAAIISGLAFLFTYFSLTVYLTGSWTSRFSAIAGNAYLNDCSYADLPIGFLLKRLAYGFWEMGIQRGLFPGIIFLLACLAANRFKIGGKDRSLLSFSTLTAVVFLLSSNFMTISPFTYNPMCLAERHYLFLTPLLAIPAALLAADFIGNGRLRLAVPIVALGLAAVAWQIDENIFLKLWLPLAITVSAFGIWQGLRAKMGGLFPVFASGCLLFISWDIIPYAKQVNYRAQRDWVKSEVEKLEAGSVVYANPVQERLTRYYLGFDTGEISVKRYTDMGEDSDLATKKAYFVVNPYTQNLSGISEDELPYTVKNADGTSTLVSEDAKTGMGLFKIEKLIAPRTQGEEALEITENFEKANSTLDFQPDNYINYGGRNSYRLGEYSATLRLPFDSIKASPKERLFVLLDLDVRTEKETTAMIITSVEKDGKSLFRNEKYLVRQGAVLGAWSKVKNEISIPQVTEPGASLLVYIWNFDGDEVYIDSLDLKIKTLQNIP